MVKRLIAPLLLKRGFKKLSREIHKLNGLNLNAAETIDFLFSKHGALLRPWQFKEELLQLALEIETQKPGVALEIGTANGGTLFMLSRLAAPEAQIISVDLPGGKFGGGYPDWKIPLYGSFAHQTQQIKLIRANSHLKSTFWMVKEALGERKIDYLFIDGDHTYEGVKQDFHLYKPLLSQKCIIAMHDIVDHKGSQCKVSEFWKEIKGGYDFREFVNNWDQNRFGIGILKMGTGFP